MQNSSNSSNNNDSAIVNDVSAVLFAINASGIGVWKMDIRTNTVVWDERCRELYGLAKGNNIPYEVAIRHIHPEDAERVKTAVAATLSGATNGHYDERYRTIGADDGQLRWVHFKGQIHTDAAGEPDYLVGTAQDITEMMLAQETAAFSERLANLALQNTDIGCFFLDLKNDTIEYSPAYAHIMTGDAQAKLTRSAMLKHLHPEDELSRQIAFEKGIRTGEFYFAPRTIWQDGSVHHTRVNGIVNYNSSGKPASIFGIIKLTDQEVATGDLEEIAENRFRTMVQQVTARKKMEESRLQLLNSFEQSPVAIAFISGADLRFQMANPFYGQLVGRVRDEIIGKPLLEALPELRGQGFDHLLNKVISTGIPYVANEVAANIVRNNQLETVYVDLMYQPQREADNSIGGVLVVATDVTAQVLARKKIEESENRYRTLIQAAPIAIGLFVGRELIVEEPNQTFIDIVGKGWGIVGKTLAEAMPELDGQPFLQILDDVYTSGEIFQTFGTQVNIVQNGVMKYGFYDFSYTPLFDADGNVYAILDIAIDVTEQVVARKKIEESELFARSILENSPVAKIVFTGEEMILSVVNEKMLEMLGRNVSIIGKPFMEAVPELLSTPLMSRLRHVFTTGEMFYNAEEKYELIRYGQPYTGYYSYACKALFNTEGKIYGIINTAVEVTEQVLAKQKMKEAEESLLGAIELAKLGTWSLDLTTGLLTYSDRLNRWFGLDGTGPITIEQAYQPIAESDRPLVKASMTHAITPGSDGIYDVEYTAIDQKTGRERILHAQGKALFNEQGVAYKVNGTAQDVTEQRRIQLALEQQVQERTEELAASNEELQSTNEDLSDVNERLQRSNEELAQYAYVASHDLQEPLRKIRIFSGMLSSQSDLSEENTRLIAKISQSSERMSLLIRDLLEFSRLLNSEALIKSVDLGEICHMVVNDFELAIAEKNAVVKIGQLPVIEAVSLQMNQLFYNLLSNALKFSKPNVLPVIEINARLIGLEIAREYIPNADRHCRYYYITFSDNGIGFEEKYSEQIFEVFKRLHGRDVYSGSGIGLALARRIVANQRGHLFATSLVGEGTTFHIILPDWQVGSR